MEDLRELLVGVEIEEAKRIVIARGLAPWAIEARLNLKSPDRSQLAMMDRVENRVKLFHRGGLVIGVVRG